MKLSVPDAHQTLWAEKPVRKNVRGIASNRSNCVEQIVSRKENIDCDFSRCGHLEVGVQAGALRRLRKNSAAVDSSANSITSCASFPKKELRNENWLGHLFRRHGWTKPAARLESSAPTFSRGLPSCRANALGACLCDHTRVWKKFEATSFNGAHEFPRAKLQEGPSPAAGSDFLASGRGTTDRSKLPPALRKKNHSPSARTLSPRKFCPDPLARRTQPTQTA